MAGRQGFTLIEVLAVVLILAALMAVALPLYWRAVQHSQRGVCHANMQTIVAAEQSYKLRDPAHQYTDDLNVLTSGGSAGGDLQVVPLCPSAGTSTYTVTINDGSQPGKPAGSLTVSCSTPGHGEFTPGKDAE